MIVFRNATLSDLEDIVKIEAACFPSKEAASMKSLEERIKVFPDGFLLMTLNDKVIGFINGAATNRRTIIDPMFENMKDHHKDHGDTIAIYGVDVHPDYQGEGYSRPMMEQFINKAREDNRKYIILTCKEHLVDYYSSFGYQLEGVSDSCHGGAKWFDMVMDLKVRIEINNN